MCLTSTRHQLGLPQTQPNSEQAANDTKNSRMPVKTSDAMASVCTLVGTIIVHFLRTYPAAAVCDALKLSLGAQRMHRPCDSVQT